MTAAVAAAGRRRGLRLVIEKLLGELPAARAAAAPMIAALEIFGADEIEIVDGMTSVFLQRRDGTRRGAEAVLHCMAAVVSRLLRGRIEYGELTIGGDPRDFNLERDEELTDALVYEAIRRIQVGRCGDMGIQALSSAANLDPLRNVGRHVEHSTLAALVRRVQDAERPTPFEIPAPWCLASALLFQLGAVRIESNQVVGLRCNQCGHEWPLSSTELRITGNGQYVIPTHRPFRTEPPHLPPLAAL
jgi:hypothetical protein